MLAVLRVQAGQFDLNYLRAWADQLGVADLLARAEHAAILLEE